MVNVKKQIGYWKKSVFNDKETNELLIKNGKTLNGLFFCHLTIEKILKAHYVKRVRKLAPKTHNLIFLGNFICNLLSKNINKNYNK